MNKSEKHSQMDQVVEFCKSKGLDEVLPMVQDLFWTRSAYARDDYIKECIRSYVYDGKYEELPYLAIRVVDRPELFQMAISQLSRAFPELTFNKSEVDEALENLSEYIEANDKGKRFFREIYGSGLYTKMESIWDVKGYGEEIEIIFELSDIDHFHLYIDPDVEESGSYGSGITFSRVKSITTDKYGNKDYTYTEIFKYSRFDGNKTVYYESTCHGAKALIEFVLTKYLKVYYGHRVKLHMEPDHYLTIEFL